MNIAEAARSRLVGAIDTMTPTDFSKDPGKHFTRNRKLPFQNLLLLERTRNLLEEEGFQVLVHSLIPANDGGIALGQAYYGMSVLQRTMSVRLPRESGT